MSNSDSESLEFESADEGQEDVDVDIDLSDLDDDDDDANLKNKSNDNKIESNEAKDQDLTVVSEANSTILNDGCELNTKITEESKVEETPTDKIIESEKEESIKEEAKNEVNQTQEIISNKVEGDDEIESMLSEMGLTDSNSQSDALPEQVVSITQDLNKKAEAEALKLVELEEKATDKKLKEEIQVAKPKESGWDEDELELDDELIDNAADNLAQESTKPSIKSHSIESELFKKQETVVQKQELKPQQQDPQKQGGWSWSKIGSNFISSAVTLTSTLGGGLNTVLETVEATIGAPDPAELAAKVAKAEKTSETTQNEAEKLKEKNDWDNDADGQEWFSLPPFNKLATTSLEVLETVGKKTIEVINDNDPNFKNTRSFLSKVPSTIVPIQQKPSLSQLLREAQQSPANEPIKSPSLPTSKSQVLKEKQEKLSFSLFFDEYKGSVHLEALEMLSNQTSVKLEMLSLEKTSSNLNDTKTKLKTLEHIFDAKKFEEMDESENSLEHQNDLKLLISNKDKMFDVEHFEFLMNDYARRSHLKLILDKVIGAYRTTSFGAREITSLSELYNESIKCFALIASNIIEMYHKAAESLLIDQQNPKKTISSKTNPVENAETLYEITNICVRSVTILADSYSKKCKIIAKDKSSQPSTPISSNQIVTDIYLEASNTNTYITDAFVLFLPIFKSQVLDNNRI